MAASRVIITGAASGLGRALAHRLIPVSKSVVLIDKNRSGLISLSAKNTQLLVCDFSRPASIASLVKRLSANKFTYDLVINCAGIGSHTPIPKLTPAEIINLTLVNSLAPLLLSSSLISASLLSRSAWIINIGSIAGELSLPRLSLYSASKAFLHSFTRSARTELHSAGINFLLVILGSLSDTNFGSTITHVSKNIPFASHFRTPADQAAAAILVALTRKQSQLIYPAYLRPVLFLNRLFPGLIASFASFASDRL